MALGIVNSKEFEAALSDSSLSNNEVNQAKIGQIIDIPSPGRKTGDNNVPSSLRKVIGSESNIEGRSSALHIARSFGISDSQVSAYNNGATSDATYNTPDKSLTDHIFNSKSKVTKRAMSRLLKSFNHMTDDKFEAASLNELTSAAKNLSAIVKEMNPSDDSSTNKINPVQFIVMAPQIINENRFESIYVKE
jgi:hypothetical protein